MTFFRKELHFGPFAGDSSQNRSVLVCTVNTDNHLNIYTDYGKGGDCMCLSPAQAKQLRDVLIQAYPVDKKAAAPATSGWVVGAKVRRNQGSKKGMVMTITEIGPAGSDIKVNGMSGWRMRKYFDLVEEPVLEDFGSFIVSRKEGGVYKPSQFPAIHVSRSAAEHEASRLAKLHGGTFHVLRAVHEASREVVVAPPVKTKSL